jgi:hypothetical protein
VKPKHHNTLNYPAYDVRKTYIAYDFNHYAHPTLEAAETVAQRLLFTPRHIFAFSGTWQSWATNSYPKIDGTDRKARGIQT